MSRLFKLFSTLRTHPKKSIFFSALATYFIKRGNNMYEEEKLLAAYCREAAQYGEQRFPLSATHRHITVLLNPAADGNACKARFDKYCAPLLHLAGIKVAVVRTEYQGQARELMELMDKTDGVVVAGGDGTLSEVLTGLLRRTDNAAARLPLCVLPLGSASVTARALCQIPFSNKKVEGRELLEATMAVVRQSLRTMDVLEVTPHPAPDADPLADAPKPIYAGSLLDWSAYRDARERRDKYWYWASLKKYITYIFSSYKDLTWSCAGSLEFTLPCDGCARCRAAAPPTPTLQPSVPPPTHNKQWYQYLLPDIKSSARLQKQQTKQPTMMDALQPDVDYSVIHNPACGVAHLSSVEDVCDVRVSGPNTGATYHLQHHEIALQTGVSNTSTWEFIEEGWRRTRTGEPANEKELVVGSVKLTPTSDTKNKEGEDREFSLDGEGFEVRPVTVRALPRAVMIFALPLAAAA